mmetsp:Transcript_27456/g.84725  ORF Transcript_27456/g.84725 Transcript_27456/m.84725 type:complete len:216 (+) Transcript_27456:597-1244(+)
MRRGPRSRLESREPAGGLRRGGLCAPHGLERHLVQRQRDGNLSRVRAGHREGHDVRGQYLSQKPGHRGPNTLHRNVVQRSRQHEILSQPGPSHPRIQSLRGALPHGRLRGDRTRSEFRLGLRSSGLGRHPLQELAPAEDRHSTEPLRQQYRGLNRRSAQPSRGHSYQGLRVRGQRRDRGRRHIRRFDREPRHREFGLPRKRGRRRRCDLGLREER